MSIAQLSFPGRKFRPRKPPPAPERATMIALADFMRMALYPDVRFNHFPSGELRTPQTGALLKRMGHQPGWADFILLDKRSTRTCFIELKRGARGRLSPEQAEFAAFCQEGGFGHAVCGSFSEAEAQLRAWGMLHGRVR